MIVTQDAYLYLRKDLTCSTDIAVAIYFPQGDDAGVTPHVTVDLRGRTLRGTGTNRGVAAPDSSGSTFVTVKNGRISGFGIGLVGTTDTRVSKVALVSNGTGFFCNGYCQFDQVRFETSSLVGLRVGGEAHAVVKRSMFRNNAQGALYGYLYTMEVDHSKFIGNGIGIHGASPLVPVTVSRSDFYRNDTAILIDGDDPDPAGCADLIKVRFRSNGQDLAGPRC